MRPTNQASRLRIVLVTCPTRAVATRIASALVKGRLAACVNIVPSVESLFWWKGAVERARECLLIIKTTTTRFPQLTRTVVSFHPYGVPEVIAFPISAGYQPYLRWIHAAITPHHKG